MSDLSVFRRFVALGDSTTEGLDDLHPGGSIDAPVYRGWADRLAERLAAEHEGFAYANLAVRGRLVGQIHEQQLEPALAMEPDLASVVGGVNDLLRPKFDLDHAAGHLEAMVRALRGRGTTVLMMTLPDLSSSMRIAGLVSRRLAAFNGAIRGIAARSGATLADMASELAEYDPRGWSPDRLHASPLGHEYLMLGAASVLGMPGAADALETLKRGAPDVSRAPWPKAYASEAAWAWRHLRPWVMRRVKGISSGDGVSAKRPQMLPVLPLVEPAEG